MNATWCRAFWLAWLPLLLAAAPASFAGSQPSGIVDGGDAIYGTTLTGGPNCRPQPPQTDPFPQTSGCGIVYRLSYDGSDFRILHAFDGIEGGRPVSPPVVGPDGILYGGASTAGVDDGRTVVYSLHRDGTQFRVLYTYAAGEYADPLATVTTDGALYATVPAKPQAKDEGEVPNEALAVIAGGAASIVHDFGGAIVDLRADGNGVIVVVAGERGGSALFSIDQRRVVTRLLPSAAPDSNAFYVGFPVASNGTIYAAVNSSVVRISGGALTPLHTFPQLDRMGPPGMQGMLMSRIAVTPDGSIVGETSQLRNLNCGTVFSLTPQGAYTLLATLPQVRGGSCLGGFGIAGSPPSLAVAGDGTVYGTASQPLTCGTDARCGSVFSVARGVVATIHSFVLPSTTPQPVAANAEKPAYVAVPTGVPRRYLLRLQTSLGVASTPSPQSVAIVSEATKAVTPLRLIGPTAAPSDANDRVKGSTVPALSYESPTLSAGLYHLVVAREAETPFYLAPEPDAAPRIAAGQRFLALPGVVAEPTLDSDGNTLGTNPAVLISTGRNLRFRIGSTGGSFTVVSNADSATEVAGMIPIVEDSTLAAARSRYVGKRVYPTANFDPSCVDGLAQASRWSGGGSGGSLRVGALYRLYGVVTTVNLGEGDPGALMVVDPLVVAFAKPLPRVPTAPERTACTGFYTVAADPWHLERMLSLRPLVDPSWPARFRTAIAHAMVVPGMTYDMVVASIGYPTNYGTIARLKHLNHWAYERPVPFGADVYFKNGTVTKYDPPGELP
jgi:hypothetical protein